MSKSKKIWNWIFHLRINIQLCYFFLFLCVCVLYEILIFHLDLYSQQTSWSQLGEYQYPPLQMGKLNPPKSELLVDSDIAWNSPLQRCHVTWLDLLFQPHLRPSIPNSLRSSHMGLLFLKFILSSHSIFLGCSSSYLHVELTPCLLGLDPKVTTSERPPMANWKKLSWTHHNYITLLVLLHSFHHYLILSYAFVSCLFLSLPRI